MGKQVVDFEIDEEGNVVFEITGVKGKACEPIATGFSKVLGEETVHKSTHEARQSQVRMTVGGKK